MLIYYLFSKSGSGLDVHMFFLGAGFMLLEVKAIAKLALIFGSTWIVNSVVISAILLLIMLANLLKYRFPEINFKWIYVLLFITVFIDYIAPPDMLSGYNNYLRIFVNTFIACLPIFFAAIIFADSFSKVKKPGAALGSNLFGAMTGGALEYFSMLMGIKFLSVVVILLYLLSFISVGKIIGHNNTPLTSQS